MKYRLLVDLEVLEFAFQLSVSLRRRLFVRFGDIQLFPGNFADFAEVDSEGRTLQVSLFDEFHIYYWIDEADRHVKILRIARNE